MTVSRASDLSLLMDLDLSIRENSWRRYLRSHAARPTPDDLSRPTSLISPTGFGRRTGLIFAGTSSGLVHIWRLPQALCECILPSPLPLGEAVPVSSLVYQCFEARMALFLNDCASPFNDHRAFNFLDPPLSNTASTLYAGGIETPITDRTPENKSVMSNKQVAFLWSFYGDCRVAIWNVNGAQSASGPNLADVVDNEYFDSDHPLIMATTDGVHSFQFPKIESPVLKSSQYSLKRFFDWKEETLNFIQDDVDCSRRKFLRHVCSDWEIINSQSCNETSSCPLIIMLCHNPSGEYGLITMSPLIDDSASPIISFNLLREFGVSSLPPDTSTLAATLADIPLATPHHLYHPVCCLILAYSGWLRVLQLTGSQYSDEATALTVDIALVSRMCVRRRANFTGVTYEPDFDELILALRSGELVSIRNFGTRLRESR